MRTFGLSPRLLRGRSRGQSLVEFSLVVVPFFIIFFSTVEFALIMSSIGTYNFAARDAARLGSLLGRTDPLADSEIVAVVRSHAQGLVMAKPLEVDIYRSSPDGYCLDSSSNPLDTTSSPGVSVDDVNCTKNVYLIDGTVKGGTTILWPVNARNDTLLDADYLGVRVVYQYTYLTGFIASVGTPLNLSAISVQRIEPQDFQGWRANPRAGVAPRLAARAESVAGSAAWNPLLSARAAVLTRGS